MTKRAEGVYDEQSTNKLMELMRKNRFGEAEDGSLSFRDRAQIWKDDFRFLKGVELFLTEGADPNLMLFEPFDSGRKPFVHKIDPKEPEWFHSSPRLFSRSETLLSVLSKLWDHGPNASVAERVLKQALKSGADPLLPNIEVIDSEGQDGALMRLSSPLESAFSTFQGDESDQGPMTRSKGVKPFASILRAFSRYTKETAFERLLRGDLYVPSWAAWNESPRTLFESSPLLVAANKAHPWQRADILTFLLIEYRSIYDKDKCLEMTGDRTRLRDAEGQSLELNEAIERWNRVLGCGVGKSRYEAALDDLGSTALHAVMSDIPRNSTGHAAVIEHLAALGADFEARDAWGRTPYMKGISRGFCGAKIEVFIERHPDFDKEFTRRDRLFRTLLQTAVLRAMRLADSDPNPAISLEELVKVRLSRGPLQNHERDVLSGLLSFGLAMKIPELVETAMRCGADPRHEDPVMGGPAWCTAVLGTDMGLSEGSVLHSIFMLHGRHDCPLALRMTDEEKEWLRSRNEPLFAELSEFVSKNRNDRKEAERGFCEPSIE